MLSVNKLIPAGRGLAAREAAIVTWLAATAAIHIVVEGYVVTTPDYYTDTSGNFLAEICERLAGMGGGCGGPRFHLFAHHLPHPSSPLQGKSTPRPTRGTPPGTRSRSAWRR
jgi:hypothetical protein